MASPYSHGAFSICIAITIVYALAASDDNIVEASCFTDSNVSQSQVNLDKLIRSTVDHLSTASQDYAVGGAIERTIMNSTSYNNDLALSALGSCRELISLAMDNLNNSLSSQGNTNSWLCAAGISLQTSMAALIDGCTRTTDQLGQDPSARSHDQYPRWLSSEDRRILRGSKIAADVVVAKDGSGKYKRVSDALKAVPTAVQGQGFIARDMRFMNTAGPINQQAVALLSTADRSVFYKCRMDGYQDTLFAHSNRQFYRECHIYGTVDFIFGGASVVIQKSLIFARKPLHGQENVITAHYRKDRQCQTGIIIQSSTILFSISIRIRRSKPVP